MKKLILSLFIAVVTVTAAFSQVPQKFTYQAVVRDAGNNPVANHSVSVRISILQGDANGVAVYVENQSVTTNANGLMTLSVGDGTVVGGSISAIDWANGPYFLKTETDPTGGNNYSIVGSQQLMSVPYALYADKAANSFSGDYNDLTNQPQIPEIPENVSYFQNDAGYITMDSIPEIPENVSAFINDAGYITMYSVPEIPENVSTFTNDAGYLTEYIEQQVLSISNDTIYLTGGSFVKLPEGFDGDYNSLSNRPELFSGDYNDLTNQPQIPEIPENVSYFQNDAGYITMDSVQEIPENVSAFTNDAGYLTEYIEQQVLSISNDTIYLTGGSFVKLPEGFDGDYNSLSNRPDLFSGDYNDLTNQPQIPEIPENVSAFTNDAGYLTSVDCGNINICEILAELQAQIDDLQHTVDSLSGQGGGEEETPVDAQPCPGTPTVTDIDGNVYNTVWIGQQCWMKENLRTTKYADNTEIPVCDTCTSTEPYRYAPENIESNVTIYGYLYNWAAVMHGTASSAVNPSEVQGICPTGWHVPSDAEWTQLTDYVGRQNQYCCSSNTSNVAKSLSSTTGWYTSSETCAVGNIPLNNNATGFNALPAGNHNGYTFGSIGTFANFWSATETGLSGAYPRLIFSYSATVSRSSISKKSGFSVRCLRDECISSSVQLPTVTTFTTDNITATSATCGGNVTNNGGGTVTARGVCWSISQNPTINDNHTTDGTDTGSFTSTLTGLTASTTYYVRAYATNNVGTAYGNEVSFTTLTATTGQDAQPCPNTPTVTDIEGNVYNTVQIGQQCWMKENLRTTRYADNTEIPVGNSYSDTEMTYRYAPDNNANNVATYGYLYNWPAVMHGTSSSTSNPSGVQGICPTGWHVPSDAEWTQLTDYVRSQSLYVCESDNIYIAKSLSSTIGWDTSSVLCAVGNEQSMNNATGFGALPAGYRGVVGSGPSGQITIFWSASEYNSSNAYERQISYHTAPVTRQTSGKGSGHSVRCLRD